MTPGPGAARAAAPAGPAGSRRPRGRCGAAEPDAAAVRVGRESGLRMARASLAAAGSAGLMATSGPRPPGP